MSQNISINVAKIDKGSALYLLELLYEKALRITDCATSQGSTVRPDSLLLNDFYTKTFFLIEKLLNRDDLKELEGGTKHLFPTLIGYEDLDTEWEIGRSSAYAFWGDIKKQRLNTGTVSFSPPDNLEQVFSDIDEAINQYEKQTLNANATLKRFVKNHKEHKFRSDAELFAPDATIQKEVKELAVFSDGTIRFKNNPIEMRGQVKELCRLFIENPYRLVTIDDIKDQIIAAKKRQHTSFSTIAKYVSDLHIKLRPCFEKDVIFNQKKEGWLFKP